VAPIAGRIESDVARGRAFMNFSEWTTSAGVSHARAAATLTAACFAVQSGIMPKPPYPYLHPEARLSKIDIASFCAWTREQAAGLEPASPRGSPSSGARRQVRENASTAEPTAYATRVR
jgi:Haem-binding domain